MKPDYSLTTSEERVKCVEKIIAQTPPEQLTNQYLTYLADYILFIRDKHQTKKEKQANNSIITNNRKKTIDKREQSYEGIVSQLKKGEDGLYTLINNDKNQIMDNRDKIKPDKPCNIPGVAEKLKVIERLQKQFLTATGTQKLHLKKQIIEIWQEIYILKASTQPATAISGGTKQLKTIAHLNLHEKVYLDEQQIPVSTCKITLFNPTHIAFLLNNYSQLKEEVYDDFNADIRYLLIDLEDLIEETLKESEPLLYDLIVWKIDGIINETIKKMVEEKYDVIHSEQYYSTLWRQRIPKMLAQKAKEKYIYWYYSTQIYGKWKTCGRCGETKPAHPFFFSRNTSKDGLYSLCKECRSNKTKKTGGDNNDSR